MITNEVGIKKKKQKKQLQNTIRREQWGFIVHELRRERGIVKVMETEMAEEWAGAKKRSKTLD